MNPPFDITPKILNLTAEISTMIGRLEEARLKIPLVDLRRQVDVSSIHSSCVIEGNTLTLDQATDVINGKRVIGPKKDILEIKNAHKLYSMINEYRQRYDLPPIPLSNESVEDPALTCKLIFAGVKSIPPFVAFCTDCTRSF